MLNAAGDKSFVDDLAASGYCKCESSLCCYEALRFIPCFYDLFFFVFKISICKIPRICVSKKWCVAFLPNVDFNLHPTCHLGLGSVNAMRISLNPKAELYDFASGISAVLRFDQMHV